MPLKLSWQFSNKAGLEQNVKTNAFHIIYHTIPYNWKANMTRLHCCSDTLGRSSSPSQNYQWKKMIKSASFTLNKKWQKPTFPLVLWQEWKFDEGPVWRHRAQKVCCVLQGWSILGGYSSLEIFLGLDCEIFLELIIWIFLALEIFRWIGNLWKLKKLCHCRLSLPPYHLWHCYWLNILIYHYILLYMLYIYISFPPYHLWQAIGKLLVNHIEHNLGLWGFLLSEN